MIRFVRNNILLVRPIIILLLLITAVFISTGQSAAHMLGYMEQHTIFYSENGSLYFRYETQYDQNLSYIMNPYLKGDGTVAEKNYEKFVNLIDGIIVPYLDITGNDIPAEIERTDFIFTPKAGMRGGMFTAVTYRVLLPKEISGPCLFILYDRTHIGDDIDGHTYHVDKSAGAKNINISSNTLKISFIFDASVIPEVASSLGDTGQQKEAPPETKAELPPAETTVPISVQSFQEKHRSAKTKERETALASGPQQDQIPTPVSQPQHPSPKEKPQTSLDNREAATLTGFVQAEKLSIGIILVALATSLFLGMVHALSPGHGKAMVAAYLVGTRGRIRDAVILGGIVTSTHVFSVIILGLLILLVSQFIVPQRIYPWIGVGSGLLVAAVGYWMVASRALGFTPEFSRHEHHPHNHSHNQGHIHNYHNDLTHLHVPENRVTFGSLLTLGIAGGMVPCPSALVVLLLSVAVNRIFFGLAMILVFSLGLAIVLISIGILTVTASRFSGIFSSQRHWIQHLPVFSAALIMILGVAIAINSLLTAGILTFTP